ncbi:hypothetical protein [Flavivirga jejuensis]|uniref:MORN repeat protein n=1 Tax=Flavivirga jejuensis TaxID=870487 RepID=A0ABT8WRR8_9FLAO|nr:hypothetical protein [Flavivirga jejuensis]MDO5975831.1 hypothetical protein [Flavivirga jejuensis]
MKKLILLFAGLLIGLTTASATELNHQESENNLNIRKRHRNVQPIVFVENGIEFLIFPDGSFDFKTNANNTYYGNSYYKGNSRKRSVNTINGNSYNSNKKYVAVSRYRNGKVKRIGNVSLNYDRYGKITRAGSIYIDYNYKKGTLSQVGGLRVAYNHKGKIIYTHGRVNHYGKVKKYRRSNT